MWGIRHEVVAAAEGRQTTKVVPQQFETSVVLSTAVTKTGVASTAGHVITPQGPLDEDLEQKSKRNMNFHVSQYPKSEYDGAATAQLVVS